MSREQIGYMNVDAGLCWVGDPCYVMGDDASSRVHEWNKFCDALNEQKQYDNGHCEPLGQGVGFAVSTGYGDGEYPVYVEKEDGRVSRIIVDFIYTGEDDEYSDFD